LLFMFLYQANKVSGHYLLGVSIWSLSMILRLDYSGGFFILLVLMLKSIFVYQRSKCCVYSCYMSKKRTVVSVLQWHVWFYTYIWYTVLIVMFVYACVMQCNVSCLSMHVSCNDMCHVYLVILPAMTCIMFI
jgi:hypothetical protein